MSQVETTSSILADFNSPEAQRYRYWRNIKDISTRHLMAIGGISVIIAIVLIAFYLLYVVLPMFKPASMEQLASYTRPGNNAEQTLYYAMEEQREIGLRIAGDGSVVFFDATNGAIKLERSLLDKPATKVSAFSAGDPSQRLVPLGLDTVCGVLAQHCY